MMDKGTPRMHWPPWMSRAASLVDTRLAQIEVRARARVKVRIRVGVRVPFRVRVELGCLVHPG